MSAPAFSLRSYDLGAIKLEPLSVAGAATLGEAIAAMPPWSVIGWPAERMVKGLNRTLASVHRFEITVGDRLAGLTAVQYPFLHGPYLQLLAILPEYQGSKLGERALDWLEEQARSEEARQLWLCVSTFNTRARAFYERFGFVEVAVLEKLATDASDEVFMRKRLFYPAR